jgi:aminopeptidase N
MQNEVRNYLLLSLLICLTAVGAYAAYSSIGKLLPAGFEDTPVSTFLELKEYDDEKLSEYNPPAQKAVDVLHYSVDIDIAFMSETIKGDVTISIKLNDKSIDYIPLNFHDNLDIKNVEVNGTRAKFDQENEIVKIYKPDKNLDSVSVRVVYSGSPKSLGFGSFNFSKNGGAPFVYTMNEPVFASTWLPCVDAPDDKALLDMYVTNDSNCVSLSNGKLIDVKNSGNRKTYHWKTYYPISTYLIAIYSGQYKSFSQKFISSSKDTLDLDYYIFPQDIEKAKHDFEDHPEYIKVFEELFGPYPFVKEKYSVAEFLWQSGAMEHQTLTGIGSNYITGRKFFSDMLIHELSHHWWGNAVSPKTWKDIWLNEGFATYSEALYWEKEAGFAALQSTLRNKKSSVESGRLYDPGNALFSSLVYNKGAWVLHMLRREVGDSKFFIILKKYFEEFKYKNASTNDFKNVCESISGKSLAKFFDEWVYKGVGIIELAYDWKSDDASLTFNFDQIQKGYENYHFPLDVRLIYADGSSEIKKVYVTSKQQKISISVQQKPKEIILDPDKWLLANFESRNN